MEEQIKEEYFSTESERYEYANVAFDLILSHDFYTIDSKFIKNISVYLWAIREIIDENLTTPVKKVKTQEQLDLVKNLMECQKEINDIIFKLKTGKFKGE